MQKEYKDSKRIRDHVCEDGNGNVVSFVHMEYASTSDLLRALWHITKMVVEEDNEL